MLLGAITGGIPETSNAILFAVVYFLAPGFSILSLLDLADKLPILELVGLSYSVSIAFSSLLSAVGLWLPTTLRGFLSLGAILAVGFMAFILVSRRKTRAPDPRSRSFLGLSEAIVLLSCVILAFMLIGLYPALANLPGLDIQANYLQAVSIAGTKLGSPIHPSGLYPLFNTLQSLFISQVSSSVALFQMTFVFLSVFTALAFYSMATRLLRGADALTPAIASVIWLFFGGFGWLAFASAFSSNPNAPFTSLLFQANAMSYGDVGFRREFFFLALEVALALVFACVYVLMSEKISGIKKSATLFLLLLPLPFMHPYASYLLLAILLVFGIVSLPKLDSALEQLAVPMMIIGAWVTLLESFPLALLLNTPSNTMVGLGFMCVGFVFLAAKMLRKKLNRTRPSLPSLDAFSKIILPILELAFVFFVSSLVLWAAGAVKFNITSLNSIGYVPWVLYPLKTGILGLIVIAYAIFLLMSRRPRIPGVLAMLGTIVLLVIISRTVAFLQGMSASAYSITPGSLLSSVYSSIVFSFREERLLEILRVPMAIAGSVAVCAGIRAIHIRERGSLVRTVGAIALVAIVFASGVFSVILSYEYSQQQAALSPPADAQGNLFNAMKTLTSAESNPTVIGYRVSSAFLDLTGAIPITTESSAAWGSLSPELPLFVSSYSALSPIYLFLGAGGGTVSLPDPSQSYLSHLASISTPVPVGSYFDIGKIEAMSSPSPTSTTALVVPYDLSDASVIEPVLTESLSESLRLAFSFDGSGLPSVYQSPLTLGNVNITNGAFFDGHTSYVRTNGTGIGFNEIYVRFQFEPLNVSYNQVIIAQFGYGTSAQKSWEVAMYGGRVTFKLSSDGQQETVLSSSRQLLVGNTYVVECEYDGSEMTVSVDGQSPDVKQYSGGIFGGNADITIGCELFNSKPTAYSSMIMDNVLISSSVPSFSQPLYNAYDFLSENEFNYTTILSGLFDKPYQTIVLPYDDFTTYQTYQNLTTDESVGEPKTVIVLNCNGYGPFYGLFGNASSQTIEATEVQAQDTFKLNGSIQVTALTPSANATVTAWYVGDGVESPLVVTRRLGLLDLVYVDLYPLIASNLTTDRSLVESIGQLLSSYIFNSNSSSVSEWFSTPSLLFSGLMTKGSVSISSSSVIGVELGGTSDLALQLDGVESGIRSVTSLDVPADVGMKIVSSNVSTGGGYGFYTLVRAEDPTLVISNPNQVTVHIDQTAFTGNSIRMVVSGNMSFFARQPVIDINGSASFVNLYSLHPPTIVSGSPITTVAGPLELTLAVADDAIVALPYLFESSVAITYSPPRFVTNELGSLYAVAPTVVVASSSVLFFILLDKLAKRPDKSKSTHYA